jgi:hypothetical protein
MVKKLKISLDNQGDGSETVMVYCDDKEAARNDQSIRGSRWECPGDMDVAYAAISDEPDLVKKLEEDGYDVDASEYCPED